MRGLGELFTRSTKITVEDTVSGATGTFTVVGNIAPGWVSSAGYRGAMAIPGVWRATLLLADIIGGLPWHAYRARGGAPGQRLDPTPPLLERPAYPDTRMTMFSGWAMDLLHHGNAVGLWAARNAEGWPTACVPVSAESVDVKRVARGDGIALPPGTVAYRIGTGWYPAEQVFHVKGPTVPGALRGMGVLENHLVETLGLAREQQRQALNVQDAAVPTGVLKSTDEELDADDAAELKAAWQQSQHTRTVAVLNATTSYERLAWNPSETQLLEARKFSLHEIALIFGLDPSWLGAAQTSRVYSNLEMESLNLLKFSLGGWLARFEQALSAALPRGTWAQASLDALLRPDTLTRYQAHEIGIRAGFLAPSEARELENRAPLSAVQRAELQRTPATPAPSGADDGADGEDEDDLARRRAS